MPELCDPKSREPSALGFVVSLPLRRYPGSSYLGGRADKEGEG